MIKFDIDDLYLVQALDASVSMSAAATKLGVEDSSVSRRVKKIETIIGLPVIYRRGKFGLTAAGRRFLSMASTVLKEHDDFQRDIDLLKKGKNHLRIVGNSSIMFSDVPQVLEILRDRNPNIFITVDSGSMTEILKKIQENDADVGIVPEKSKIHGITFHKYRFDRLCIFAPISHPLAHQTSATLAEVAKYKLIGTHEGRQMSSLLLAMAKKQDLVLNYAMIVSNFDLQANIIAHNDMAVGIIFESVARRFEREHLIVGDSSQLSQSIKIVALNEEWATRDLYLVTPDPANTSQLATQFIGLLRERHRRFKTTSGRSS
ncbi:LysR family transcriptional regulator [Undibacterium sp. MH2W]|uniref:LysR family transcriptional regulator n=1 Tax=Undibacterium sp. MH2W TaxID=3413044 RepID=UPI003BF3B0BB